MRLTPPKVFFKRLSIEWMEAWKQKDKEKLEILLADPFCYIVPNNRKKVCLDREEWLELVLGQYELEDYKLDFVRIVIHEGMAVVVYKGMLWSRPNHTGEPVAHLVTDVWLKSGDRWLAVSRQPLPL